LKWDGVEYVPDYELGFFLFVLSLQPCKDFSGWSMESFLFFSREADQCPKGLGWALWVVLRRVNTRAGACLFAVLYTSEISPSTLVILVDEIML